MLALSTPRWLLAAASGIGLMLPTVSTAAWKSETVDTYQVGKFSPIAVDAGGAPQIVYYDDNQDSLRGATRSGGAWLTETVDSGPNGITAFFPSIAVDVVRSQRSLFAARTSHADALALHSCRPRHVRFPGAASATPHAATQLPDHTPYRSERRRHLP